MRREQLKFRFKGDRNYIQGGDMYNELVRTVGIFYDTSEFSLFRLKLYRFCSQQCEILIGESDDLELSPDRLVADVLGKRGDFNIYGYVFELSEPITDRYSYDEDRVFSVCSIAENEIRVNDECGYSAADVSVTMTKLLHNTLYPVNERRWIVTQFDLTRVFSNEDAGNLRIVLQHNFNDRLTKSAIFVDREQIGFIYFSAI